jgi:hypothetical protein
MRNLRFNIVFAFSLALTIVQPLSAGDWLTAPSFYTHDQATGQRVNQHTPPPESIIPQSPSFQTSGYSNYRSTLQFGQSADNYHRVEQWGPPVRPYGEWRFPYRPYSAPYDQWGPPFGGLNVGVGGGFGGNFGGGFGVRPPFAGDDYYGDQGFPGDTDPRNPAGPGFGWRFPNQGFPAQPFPSDPYPSGPGQAYPVPPYADGFYPDYPLRPQLDDRQFFGDPRRPSSNRPRDSR